MVATFFCRDTQKSPLLFPFDLVALVALAIARPLSFVLAVFVGALVGPLHGVALLLRIFIYLIFPFFFFTFFLCCCCCCCLPLFYPGTLNTHTLTGWRTCGFCLRRRYLVRRGVNIATLPPSSDGGILMVLPPLFFLFTQKTRLRFVRFKFDPIFQPVDVVVVLSCCLFHDLFLRRCEVTMSHRNGRPHNNILNKDDETQMK